MLRSGNSLHVMGSKVAPDVQMDVNATNALQHMKQELAACQTDNKKLTEQLNCLITLIKRSWTGDHNATVHLSNIVGVDYPNSRNGKNEGTMARPNSQAHVKTRSEQNWERFAIKLLEKDYESVQSEIREYQRRYLENRQMYMEAILQDHQHSMGRVSLHRRNDTPGGVDDIDSKFIKHNKAMHRMGVQPSFRRTQSAVTRRKPSLEKVEQMEVSLRDLVGDAPSSEHFSQQNLFDLSDRDPVRKPRPVSASSLREGDNKRSRPRSGITNSQPVYVPQKNERPLKYETTRPVKTRPATAHRPTTSQRRNSIGNQGRKVKFEKGPMLMSQTDLIHSYESDHGNSEELVKTASISNNLDGTHRSLTNNDLEEDPDFDQLTSKPPLAVRVKSAHTRRPQCIDEFAGEEMALKDLENDFKKSALSLQKKLGIDNSGLVFYS